MDQVSYRGYARSIGFDPIKAPTEGLRQMAARDERIIRGMEKNRQEIKQVRDQYGSGLERKFAAEQRDRDQDYRWKQQLRENRLKLKKLMLELAFKMKSHVARMQYRRYKVYLNSALLLQKLLQRSRKTKMIKLRLKAIWRLWRMGVFLPNNKPT